MILTNSEVSRFMEIRAIAEALNISMCEIKIQRDASFVMIESYSTGQIRITENELYEFEVHKSFDAFVQLYVNGTT